MIPTFVAFFRKERERESERTGADEKPRPNAKCASQKQTHADVIWGKVLRSARPSAGSPSLCVLIFSFIRQQLGDQTHLRLSQHLAFFKSTGPGMLIDLPAVFEYTMADIVCEDLFVSGRFDDGEGACFGDAAGSRKIDLHIGIDGTSGGATGVMVLSDLESSAYTSTSASESDLEPCDVLMSDGDAYGDGDIALPKVAREPFWHQAPPDTEREIMLHSPGTLLDLHLTDTMSPFSSSASALEVDLALSAMSTPALSPPIAATPSPASSSVNSAASVALSLSLSEPGPIFALAPAPAPVPVPSPISLSSLKHAPPVSGPYTAPPGSAQTPFTQPLTQSASTITPAPTLMHPKLSRFNPADTPVPPSLRAGGRARKAASMSAAMPMPISVQTTPRG
ncbi:hypothetical protein EW145_g6147 [Phellinidium pouzarii]|uniref:Uncharacterized protein n=1 Tax=Phellinidium pouzarii TaxID=167371 RepID=A0A4S4KXK2_9AGAM|nr:hypothetical protein EW145_g6147 [Phellinidium pouzarii]